MNPTVRRPAESHIAACRHAIAHLRLWLCALAAWFAEMLGDHPLGRAVRAEVLADVKDTVRDLRTVLLLLAMREAVFPACGARRAHAPPATRRGSVTRIYTRCVRFRGASLRGHVARLRTIIDALDACIAKVVKQLVRRPWRLAPTAIAAALLRASKARVAIMIADSS